MFIFWDINPVNNNKLIKANGKNVKLDEVNKQFFGIDLQGAGSVEVAGSSDSVHVVINGMNGHSPVACRKISVY